MGEDSRPSRWKVWMINCLADCCEFYVLIIKRKTVIDFYVKSLDLKMIYIMLNITDEQDELQNNRQTSCVGNGLEEADNLSALELHNFGLHFPVKFPITDCSLWLRNHIWRKNRKILLFQDLKAIYASSDHGRQCVKVFEMLLDSRAF